MRRRVTFVSLALVLIAAVAIPDAQQPKYLDKATYFQMESISNPTISPDGNTVLFSRGYVDLTRDQNQSNLWVIDINGDRLRQLTDGAWNDSSPVWSPDGKRIAFLSNRSGSTQLHVMWVDTRETLAAHPARPRARRRSPGRLMARQIAFTSLIPDETPILPVRLPPVPRGSQLARGAVVIDRPSWASDGSGPTTKGYTHVYVVDATVGGTPRQVTNGNFNHSAPAWANDGKSMFVSGIRKPDAEYLLGDSEIYSVNVETGDGHAADRSQRAGLGSRGVARRALDRLHRLRPEELHEPSEPALPDGLDAAPASGCGSAACRARRRTSPGRRTVPASTTRCRRKARRTPGSRRRIRVCNRSR